MWLVSCLWPIHRGWICHSPKDVRDAVGGSQLASWANWDALSSTSEQRRSASGDHHNCKWNRRTGPHVHYDRTTASQECHEMVTLARHGEHVSTTPWLPLGRSSCKRRFRQDQGETKRTKTYFFEPIWNCPFSDAVSGPTLENVETG